MWNAFKPNHWLFSLRLIITIVATVVIILVHCLVHLSPLHNINPVITFLLCLTASNHIDSHWEFIVLVPCNLVFVNNSLCGIKLAIR